MIVTSQLTDVMTVTPVQNKAVSEMGHALRQIACDHAAELQDLMDRQAVIDPLPAPGQAHLRCRLTVTAR
jgi:hypothetical protein